MSEEPTKNLPQDGVERILARLAALEEKVERRLQETRPIWEQVLARLDSFEGRLDSFETELRSGLRRFERQVGELAKDVLEVRADQLDLDRRMDRLESKPTP
jgi:chromosome segregation ATPase